MPAPLAIDYRQLFADLESAAAIPYASSETLDPQHGVFQAMYVDLAAVQKKIAASGTTPPLVTIYADVLNVPASTSWSASDPALFVIARRVQVEGRLQVGLDREGGAGGFVLFSDCVAGDIEVTAADPAHGPQTFTIDAAAPSGGVQVDYGPNGPQQTARKWAQGMSAPPAPSFEEALFTEFLFAVLLMDTAPEIAVEQLTWITHWAAEAPQLLSLFYRSGALLALLTSQLGAQANAAAFVPYLSRSLYADLAEAFAAEASEYEQQYETLATKKLVDDQFIAQAKTLLASKVAEGKFVQQRLAQARSNYENAVAGVEAAKAKFEFARREARSAEIGFKEMGIPKWKEEKIIEAVISLGTAVITFGVGVAGLLAGQGEVAAAGAAEAVEEVEAVAEAAKAGSELARNAERLKKTLEDLKKMIEALAAVYAFAQGVAKVAGEIGSAGKTAAELKEMDLSSGGADLTATYEWEAYRAAADQAIEEPVKNGIEYAAALKLAVDEVAIYGQAMAAAQLGAITASQEYAAVALQLELTKEEQQQLETYVAELQQGEQPIVAMMQRFYRRCVDAKSSLRAAIEDYRASYYYWALEPSATEVSLVEPVGKLSDRLTALTAIKLDETTALERFKSPPQEVTRLLAVIEDPAVLAALREDGRASWTIDLDHFKSLSRLRLDCVRIWIRGAKPRASSPVMIAMKTTGGYLDRYEDTRFQFVSKPLERIFSYEVTSEREADVWNFGDGTYGIVNIDGRVDREVEYAYFRPTPFSTWTIDLTKHNEGIDLSGVDRITMAFAGSAIGDVAAAMESPPLLS